MLNNFGVYVIWSDLKFQLWLSFEFLASVPSLFCLQKLHWLVIDNGRDKTYMAES